MFSESHMCAMQNNSITVFRVKKKKKQENQGQKENNGKKLWK